MRSQNSEFFLSSILVCGCSNIFIRACMVVLITSHTTLGFKTRLVCFGSKPCNTVSDANIWEHSDALDSTQVQD